MPARPLPLARLLPFTAALSLAAVLGSPAAAERLITRTYTVANGLASDRAMSLATDREGFLWVCTDSGLSRFDGSAFTTFRTGSGLPLPLVNHFLHSRAGTRWVATNGGGVARLNADSPADGGRVFTSFPVGKTLRSNHVNLLFESRTGALLAGTDEGLFRARSTEGDPDFVPIPLLLPGAPDSGLQIWSMIEDRAGDLWIGTSAGLVRLRMGDPVEHWPVSPFQGADHVWTMVSDDAGRLWLGHDLGLVVWAPPGRAASGNAAAGRRPLLDGATACSISSGDRTAMALPTDPGQACHWTLDSSRAGRNRLVRPELQAADGTIWMTSEYGLVTFDGIRLHVYAEPEPHVRWLPHTLAEDVAGDLWVATTQGVARVSRQGFVQYTREDGLAEQSVNRIFQGPEGIIFAVTPTSRIHRFHGDRWTATRPNVPKEIGLGGRSVYGAILVDHRGEWWVGSGNGLFRFPRVAVIEELARIRPRAHYTVADGLAGNDIWRLHEDTRGDLWIATRIPDDEPLTRWRRQSGELQRFGPEQGLPARQAIRGFTEDRAGGLWVTSSQVGLARFDGTRFRLFVPGRDLPRGTVGGSIHADRSGRLWATVGGVLIQIPDPAAAEPRISPYPAPRNSFDSTVGVLTEDDAGWIYVRSSRGLTRVLPESGAYDELGSGTPFTSIERAYRDDRGTLWFATTDGILRYEPRPPPPIRPPPVWIRRVRVAGVPQQVPAMGIRSLGPLRLTTDQRQMQIEYFGLGFGADELLRFQVRLDGADEEWGEPTTRRSARYAGLGSGRYRFRVRAVSPSGQISRHPATVAFSVPAPIWGRPWFITLAGVLLATLLVVAHRLRVRRLVELERVRTRIATDLHDDLGASLARISVLSEVGRRQLGEDALAASRLFSEIGQVAREIIAAAGDIAYAIDPGRGGLTDFVARIRRSAADLLEPAGIAFTVRDDLGERTVTLSSEQRRHLLACVKEAIHNAVRHADPRQVTLSFGIEADNLVVHVADDGRGLEPNVVLVTPPTAHRGLDNMRGRLRELGGRLEIDSHPGQGTRLTLRVPL